MFRSAALFSVACIAVSGSLFAQSTVYTRPMIPAAKDLDRLNLEMAWQTALPVDGPGDGVVTVQLIDNQVFVQLRSGPLVAIDAITGEFLWKAPFARKYATVLPIGVNATRVFVANGPYLYMIDRKTGRITFKVDLPSMAAVQPVADAAAVYLCLTNNRMIAFGYQGEDIIPGLRQLKRYEPAEPRSGANTVPDPLDELSTTKNVAPSVGLLHTLRPPFKTVTKDETPSFTMLPSLKPPYRLDVANRTPSIGMGQTSVARTEELAAVNTADRPKLLWELATHRHIDYPPLIFRERLIVPGDDRTLFACRRIVEVTNSITQEFTSDSFISAPLGQYGQEFYVPLTDSNLFAFNIENFRHGDLPARPLRKIMAGTSIDQKPYVTDDSIFLVSSTAGITRINRRTFEKVWVNTEVEKILTVNPNFVYALDRRGNLLILDRARGLKLSNFDIRGFKAIVNEHDDRLYLTANSGLLLCLHDRAFSKPQLQKKKEPKPILDVPKDPEMVVAPRKEEPKNEQPKRELPKRELPKKEAPKKDEMKKDDAKKEEMKKAEMKKDDTKKEDAKKE